MRTLVAVAAMLGSLVPAMRAQQTRTPSDRVYGDAQAARGRTLYRAKCAICHGDTLEGKNAPPLAARAFLATCGARPLSELAAKARNTMPADDPGKLKSSDAADLVAYILQASKFPSGSSELASDEAALKSIVLAPGT